MKKKTKHPPAPKTERREGMSGMRGQSQRTIVCMREEPRPALNDALRRRGGRCDQ